jgi:hypothetical protein
VGATGTLRYFDPLAAALGAGGAYEGWGDVAGQLATEELSAAGAEAEGAYGVVVRLSGWGRPPAAGGDGDTADGEDPCAYCSDADFDLDPARSEALRAAALRRGAAAAAREALAAARAAERAFSAAVAGEGGGEWGAPPAHEDAEAEPAAGEFDATQGAGAHFDANAAQMGAHEAQDEGATEEYFQQGADARMQEEGFDNYVEGAP